MTSLLNDTIHSHLNLKVDDQGLTIHLPFSYKHPKSPLSIDGSMPLPYISPL